MNKKSMQNEIETIVLFDLIEKSAAGLLSDPAMRKMVNEEFMGYIKNNKFKSSDGKMVSYDQLEGKERDKVISTFWSEVESKFNLNKILEQTIKQFQTKPITAV